MSAGEKGDLGRLIERIEGGMNIKLPAVADANGRPWSFFMTAGHVSDNTGLAPCATRYDRCPTAFSSAVALAATVSFWL